MEYIFNKIIFGQGDYQEKKKAIEQLFTIEDLLNVPKSLCIKIVKTIGDEYGRFNVSSEFRQGNNWNSEVEGLSYVNDKLYVDIYVQNTKTDTTTSESFDRFYPFHAREFLCRNLPERALRGIASKYLSGLLHLDVPRQKAACAA